MAFHTKPVIPWPWFYFWSKIFKFYLFIIIIRPHHVACRISVPGPGVEPGPTAMKALSPNHWKPGTSPLDLLTPDLALASPHCCTAADFSGPPQQSHRQPSSLWTPNTANFQSPECPGIELAWGLQASRDTVSSPGMLPTPPARSVFWKSHAHSLDFNTTVISPEMKQKQSLFSQRRWGSCPVLRESPSQGWNFSEPLTESVSFSRKAGCDLFKLPLGEAFPFLIM